MRDCAEAFLLVALTMSRFQRFNDSPAMTQGGALGYYISHLWRWV
jgi:hypothetical protein